MKKNFRRIKQLRKKIFSSRIKVLGRFRRFYKHKLTLLNSKYVDIFHNLKNFSLKVYIRVRPNNIFCTLKNIKENKILLNKSSGMYGIKTSKNKLKYNIKIILQFFFKEITNFLKAEKNILIELVAGIKIRKKIIKLLKHKFSKKNIILQVREKKCFNGCRPPKKKRKKRQGLRVFK